MATWRAHGIKGEKGDGVCDHIRHQARYGRETNVMAGLSVSTYGWDGWDAWRFRA